MKFTQEDAHKTGSLPLPSITVVTEVAVSWGDHWPACKLGCREVNVEQSATWGKACATPGTQLLMEELTRRQAPIDKAKARAVKEGAQRVGTFVTGKADPQYVKRITRYVGDE